MPSKEGFVSTPEEHSDFIKALQEYAVVKKTLWNCSQDYKIDLEPLYFCLREMTVSDGLQPASQKNCDGVPGRNS